MKPERFKIEENTAKLKDITGLIGDLIEQACNVKIRLKLDLPNKCNLVVDRFRDGEKSTRFVNGNYETSVKGGIDDYIKQLKEFEAFTIGLNELITNKIKQ